ncbi:hypothetical protein [Pantanalinema sp. GBBB05]|uniref:hypothetical protein n=1 Tax=Pantanalinema sp. GBBB05 TaxID=2604139 RepID=UPI001D30A1FD|nr:hypothetical protein [Pantanalinema sp. GBBB05]
MTPDHHNSLKAKLTALTTQANNSQINFQTQCAQGHYTQAFAVYAMTLMTHEHVCTTVSELLEILDSVPYQTNIHDLAFRMFQIVQDQLNCWRYVTTSNEINNLSQLAKAKHRALNEVLDLLKALVSNDRRY